MLTVGINCSMIGVNSGILKRHILTLNFQETEPEWDWGESESVDEAVELLPNLGVAEPHLLPCPAKGHEADVPQQGGRGRPRQGHLGGQVRPPGRRLGRRSLDIFKKKQDPAQGSVTRKACDLNAQETIGSDHQLSKMIFSDVIVGSEHHCCSIDSPVCEIDCEEL